MDVNETKCDAAHENLMKTSSSELVEESENNSPDDVTAEDFVDQSSIKLSATVDDDLEDNDGWVYVLGHNQLKKRVSPTVACF